VELRTRAPGRAPADLVWERYAVPARWPDWAPQIRRVECTAERLTAGATGRVHGPPGITISFRITEVDPARRLWAWSVRWGPVHLRLRHGVERDGAAWLTARGPAPFVAAYLPVARFALHRLTAPA
jgi:uncharacterized protein YndB with AHSA1/START domain